MLFRRRLLLSLWAAAAVLSAAIPARAVVPGLAAPLQALTQMLPQILPFLGAAIASLFSSRTWRARMGCSLQRIRRRPAGLFVFLAVFLAFIAFYSIHHRLAHRTAEGTGAAGATQSGRELA